MIADSTAARLAHTTGRHPQYLLAAADTEWDDLDVDDAASDRDTFGSYQSVLKRRPKRRLVSFRKR
ncbi:MAG: hypothetical protein ACI8TP_001552 [Acidimicrobiales bacterium]